MLVGNYKMFKKKKNGYRSGPEFSIHGCAGILLHDKRTVLTCAHFGTLRPEPGEIELLFEGVAYAAWRLNCTDESQAIPSQYAGNVHELRKLKDRGVTKIISFQSFQESAMERLHWESNELFRRGNMNPTRCVVDLAIVQLASPIKGDIGILPIIKDPFQANLSIEHQFSGMTLVSVANSVISVPMLTVHDRS